VMTRRKQIIAAVAAVLSTLVIILGDPYVLRVLHRNIGEYIDYSNSIRRHSYESDEKYQSEEHKTVL